MKPKNRIIAIIGPTASGKSSLAIQVAKSIKGEIISADSRQVYKHLDIGTGKVTKAQQKLTPHHLLDVTSVRHQYTVAHFIRDARRKITDVHKREHVPIVVGGTGFWIDALLQGLKLPKVKPNPLLRKQLVQLTTTRLYPKLLQLDPFRARTIDRKNRVRLIRALEIVMVTGKPVPHIQKETHYDVLWLGLDPGRDKLRRMIRERLHARLRQGMLGEVRHLLKSGVTAKRLLDLGLEYKFVTLFLQGKLTKPEMTGQLERAINQYAKRQRTWFKRNHEIHWVHAPFQALKLTKAWIAKQGIG
jgi:tRNA dimethylallyltransferase